MTRRSPMTTLLHTAAAPALALLAATPALADVPVTRGIDLLIRQGAAPATILKLPTYVPNGKPVDIVFGRDTVDKGILRCQRRTLGTAVVSEECVTRNMPLIEQTDPRIPADLAESAGVGCFDASILTVLLTQMAFAHPSVKVEGRTAMLAKAVGNAAVPPEVAALTMLYRMQTMGQRQRDLKAAGYVDFPHASYYRLQEAAPDFNATRVIEQTANPPCDPYADVWCPTSLNLNAQVMMDWATEEKPASPISDAMIEQRMRAGQSMVLGYVRFTPRVVGIGAARRIRFDATTPHKIVPSGFSTTGKYRLILNDVGYTGVKRPECNGGEGCKRFRGTLRRDIAAKLVELGYPNVPFDLPGGVGPVLLEQEGDTGNTIRFIEFVNSLSVRKAT